MLHLLWTALIGLIVGAIAKFIIPGMEPGSVVWLGTMGPTIRLALSCRSLALSFCSASTT
jgi:uncharacterized membrane protein YeaQ/YmgE (transglycosylase-associated protein family)